MLIDKDPSIKLATVSGVASTNASMIRFLDQEAGALSIITTKSFQLKPNPGNREPVICSIKPGCFGNSVGLRNPGMEAAISEIKSLGKLRCKLNISLSASSPEDFIALLKGMESLGDSFELNFSCPHAQSGFGSAIGSDARIASSFVRAIRKALSDFSKEIFVKLTPNVDDIGFIAQAVMEAGASGISAINTVGPIDHIDPVSGASILLHGKGGCSGAWIKDRALEAVSQIRSAVGPEVPIIGMGGVSSHEDVKAMLEAGANAVGVGSSLASVNQSDWPAFFESLKTGSKPPFIDKSNRMSYERHVVMARREAGSNAVALDLDGSYECKAGQFVFLWLPGVGEKPFSVARNKPLSFIVKAKGPFTKALCSLAPGSQVFIRGPYGRPVDAIGSRRALVLAAGTGEAVLLLLAQRLSGLDKSLDMRLGLVDGQSSMLEKELKALGSFRTVYDRGVLGRMIAELEDQDPRDLACYLIGPMAFMEKAALRLEEMGIEPTEIMLCLEKTSLCGVGLCGQCSVSGRLACQSGTFMSWDFVKAADD